VRFKAQFTTATSSGAPPQISDVIIPYVDLGISKVDFSLYPGCGSIERTGERARTKPRNGTDAAAGTALLVAAALGAWLATRRPRNTSAPAPASLATHLPRGRVRKIFSQ